MIHQIKGRILASPNLTETTKGQDEIRIKLAEELGRRLTELIKQGSVEIRSYNDSICPETLYYINLDITQPRS